MGTDKETASINMEELKALKNVNKDPSIDWAKFIEKNNKSKRTTQLMPKQNRLTKVQTCTEKFENHSSPKQKQGTTSAFFGQSNGFEAWDVEHIERSFDN